jgi:hypothetical protein
MIHHKHYLLVWMLMITLALMLTISCKTSDNSSPEEQAQDFQGSAWAETQDEEFPVVGIHQEGSMVGIHIAENGSIDRAIFKANADSPGFQVWIGDDGLPYRGYVNGYIILFENFTETTVDLGIITPNGETEIIRKLVVDFPVSPTAWSYQNLTQSPQFSNVSSLPGNVQWSDVLHWTGHALSIGGCAASLAAAGWSLGALSPLAALGCSSAMLGLIREVVPANNPYIQASENAFGRAISIAGCTDLAGCTSFVLGELIPVAEQAALDYEQQQENVQLIEGVLKHGYGDVQVTLTWNNTADLDIWVTDPYGETIYWAHPWSASGGQLDVDDIDGYGPENIFWPSGGAPTGEYHVRVDYYSGDGAARYTVLIQSWGHVVRYSGNIDEDQTVYIARFISSVTSKALPVKKFSTVTVHEKKAGDKVK